MKSSNKNRRKVLKLSRIESHWLMCGLTDYISHRHPIRHVESEVCVFYYLPYANIRCDRRMTQIEAEKMPQSNRRHTSNKTKPLAFSSRSQRGHNRLTMPWADPLWTDKWHFLMIGAHKTIELHKCHRLRISWGYPSYKKIAPNDLNQVVDFNPSWWAKLRVLGSN